MMQTELRPGEKIFRIKALVWGIMRVDTGLERSDTHYVIAGGWRYSIKQDFLKPCDKLLLKYGPACSGRTYIEEFDTVDAAKSHAQEHWEGSEGIGGYLESVFEMATTGKIDVGRLGTTVTCLGDAKRV